MEQPTIYSHIASRLKKLGAAASIENGFFYISKGGLRAKIRLDQEWSEGFGRYIDAEDKSFDVGDLIYVSKESVTLPLARLNSNSIYGDTDDFCFGEDGGEKVVIGRATIEYCLAHFDSEDYVNFFSEIAWPRLGRVSTSIGRPIWLLFKRSMTATYVAGQGSVKSDIKTVARSAIRSCLFKLAVEKGECYEMRKPLTAQEKLDLNQPVDSDNLIPSVEYDMNVVSYYKVARSSPFASQSYLAYYHVLEYYFLKVAEDNLHYQLRSLINDPTFRSSINGIDKVISIVRKQALQDDETEMLKKVLQRFVVESDFIDFISKIEQDRGDKVYSKKRVIFGELLEISNKEGHAVSNAAKVVKHIRNAIVHSSDKYKRDDCHIPLTESESVVADFVPVVKYLAEKVIYGNSLPR